MERKKDGAGYSPIYAKISDDKDYLSLILGLLAKA